jgi:hypothetical protein
VDPLDAPPPVDDDPEDADLDDEDEPQAARASTSAAVAASTASLAGRDLRRGRSSNGTVALIPSPLPEPSMTAFHAVVVVT